jgi:hypothetical protein
MEEECGSSEHEFSTINHNIMAPGVCPLGLAERNTLADLKCAEVGLVPSTPKS